MSLFAIVSIVLATLLTILVLIQNRGAGLSGVFGGDSAVFSQRRGSEKILHIVTIIIAVSFLVSAFLNLLYS